MRRPRWLALLLLGTCILVPPSAARAQLFRSGAGPTERHLDVEKFPDPQGNPEDIVTQRLKQKRLQYAMEALQKAGLKRDDLHDWIIKNRDLQKDFFQALSDPRQGLPDDLRKFADQLSANAENREWAKSINLDDLKKQLEMSNGQELTQRAPGVGSSGETSSQHSTAPDRAGPAGSGQTWPRPGLGTTEGAFDSAENAAPKSAWTKRLIEWGERLKKANPTLANSPALNNALRKWQFYRGDQDERWDKVASSLSALGDRINGWGQKLHWERLVRERGLRWPRRLTPPSLPNVRWPELETKLGDGLSRPRIGFSNAAPSEPLPLVAAALGVIILGVLLWRRGARLAAARRGGETAWRLGPWPVNPRAISTPQELIRAFEYLSLLRLGPAARSWNHRTIAASLAANSRAAATPPGNALGMSGPSSEHCRAIAKLTALYEQARYAPPTEPFPAGEIVAARHDLALLAEAARR